MILVQTRYKPMAIEAVKGEKNVNAARSEVVLTARFEAESDGHATEPRPTPGGLSCGSDAGGRRTAIAYTLI